jgi:branched-chain amino acid transport system permease protein
MGGFIIVAVALLPRGLVSLPSVLRHGRRRRNGDAGSGTDEAAGSADRRSNTEAA